MKKTIEEIIFNIAESKLSFTSQDVQVETNNSYSRQHITYVIRNLLKEKRLLRTGSTKNARYSLPHKAHLLFPSFKKSYENGPLKEDEIFTEFEEKLPQINSLPVNARRVLRYTFTEIVNNAIDHSRANDIHVQVIFSDHKVDVEITDNGIGVFRNIMQKFGFASELESIQQLLKGKLTTLPDNHSGQGIFFSSKATNFFEIDSYGYRLIVDNNKPDVAFLQAPTKNKGTKVIFQINTTTPIVLKDIFLKFQTEGLGGPFDTTQIKVKLFAFGTEFVSRSEAKRLLERLEAFNLVILDFENVEGIGQAFADEVFRVFQRQHPNIELAAINANETIQFMIDRTKADNL